MRNRLWRLWHRIASALADRLPAWPGRKPRLLLLADRRGWAFDVTIRACMPELRRRFRVSIRYSSARPSVLAHRFDAAVVFFWGEAWLRHAGFPWWKVAKNLASHRYADMGPYGPCIPRQAVLRHMRDAGTLLAWSKRLLDDFAPIVEPGRCRRIRHGADIKLFRPCPRRNGPLVVGWAGNRSDPVKRFDELAPPSCDGLARLEVAAGELSHERMRAFYDRIDVLLVTSRHEGKPGPLYEALTSGCFIIACEVGAVSELVRSGVNGLLVDATVASYREAILWCQANLDRIRSDRHEIAKSFAHDHAWPIRAREFASELATLVQQARLPRFRNDDVGWDTPLERFRAFNSAFARNGFTQIHAVTLHGQICSFASHQGQGVTYPGYANLGRLPNDLIRQLSQGRPVGERTDLIDLLNQGDDDIALHGLYHTDYSAMTPEEQRRDIVRGLEELDLLFPRKVVRSFVPPFNRCNADTWKICRELGLTLLAGEGIHLEERITDPPARAGTVYRYHHHRFYPESTCRFYPTTQQSLENALATIRARLLAQGESLPQVIG